MKVFLSSIAKNDIRLLMRVFNAEKENMGIDFLEDLKVSVGKILNDPEMQETQLGQMVMQNFPVHIHYIVESKESLLVTAIFKELN
ncbi:hypothetical protein PMI13_01314 [Chryseobacterium populi]|uniref:Plasmid stabilization system protein n=2 Tax=Chryseobacterium populi TaxID=1144316 RepID=J2T748_9FLAO|nr:hypothetical protein PMI13_01314 [Chryseobacterium populi]